MFLYAKEFFFSYQTLRIIFKQRFLKIIQIKNLVYRWKLDFIFGIVEIIIIT